VGTPGEVYYFRAQAIDKVNNLSEWVEVGPVEVKAVTKYYSFGGQRVAMRQGDEVYYLHGDHLGSTSLTTNSEGNVVSEVRYHPYGQERWANGEAVTDFGFTSQRNEASFGLMDYNARYYSPRLGRFVSPDSIVPEPGSSGGFNRYRYSRNNPLRYVDPSGHIECAEAVECTPTDYQRYRNTVPSFQEQQQIQENLKNTVLVGTAFWTVPIAAWTAPQALAPMITSGVLGEVGYTGSR
jgi:RHS repeat-associated protein